MVVGGQGGGVKMFGLRGVRVGVAAVFCGGRKCKKKTYRRTFVRLQVLLIYFFSLGLFRLRLPQEAVNSPAKRGKCRVSDKRGAPRVSGVGTACGRRGQFAACRIITPSSSS